MAQNVLFKVGTRAQFDAIVTKSEITLYWLSDTQELYKGDVLFGTGALATQSVAGLLSPEDKKKLDELVSGGVSGLSAVDGTIVLTDDENGGKKIGVAISDKDGNALVAVEGGLFVAPVDLTDVQNRLTAVEGSITQLQEDIVGGIRYKGAVATIDELPADAKQGDLYEVTGDGSEWCYNGEKWFEYGSAHFTPVAGNGIQVNGNEIAVNIAEESHGLVAVDGALSINLATAESDGAMSKDDKAALDALIALKIAENYATKEEMQTISDKVAASEESFTWGEM
jgi:hypothetical protein